jgi:hypothetical protein
MEREIQPKMKGWKEGALTEDLRSLGGTTHKKGSIVRCQRRRTVDTPDGRWDGTYEWYYLDQTNYNLVRSNKFLIEESKT